MATWNVCGTRQHDLSDAIPLEKELSVMHARRLAHLALVALALAMVTPGPGLAQTPSGAAKTTNGSKSGWTPARTPDGQPDIQGIWTNYDSTPFETFSKEDKPNLYAGDPEGTSRGTGPASFPVDVTGRKLSRRTSLVVEPANGRVPILPWAEQKRDHDLVRVADAWEYQTAWERCITRGVPGGIFPASYNSGYRIVQTPGYVVIHYEMIHEARIIPLDGRPHAPAGIRLWNGDSRGHWEGQTLVVDITNYNSKGNIATNIATQRIRALPQSEALHVVERFTPVDANAINYEVTIDDPKVFASPWKVAIPFTREQNHEIFEYACHEGNYAMPNTLSAGRAKDKTSAHQEGEHK